MAAGPRLSRIAEFTRIYRRCARHAARGLRPPRPSLEDVADWQQRAAERGLKRLDGMRPEDGTSMSAMLAFVMRQELVEAVRHGFRDDRGRSEVPIDDVVTVAEAATAAADRPVDLESIAPLLLLCTTDLERATVRAVAGGLDFGDIAILAGVSISAVVNRLRRIARRPLK